MSTLLKELGMEKPAKRAVELAQKGDISFANGVIERIREDGDGSSTTDLNLLCLKRQAYREYIGFCLDSAETELDNEQLDDAKMHLETARTHASKLNGRDAKYFLFNAPPLYTRLDKLKRAQA